MRTGIVGILLLLAAGCATTPTSTQMQNLNTDASQVPMGYAGSALEIGACVELSKHELRGRPGITLGQDLKILEDEIDGVVSFNGGNAYMIHSWEWIVVDSMGSTAPLVEVTVLTCGESPSTVKTIEATVESPEAAVDEVSEIDFCKDFSVIAKEIMTARQKGKPMSETLPIAIARFIDWADKYGIEMDREEAEEASAGLVMAAYERPSWESEVLQREEISEFENAVFKECYEGLTSASEE